MLQLEQGLVLCSGLCSGSLLRPYLVHLVPAERPSNRQSLQLWAQLEISGLLCGYQTAVHLPSEAEAP